MTVNGRAKTYACPNCGSAIATQQNYVRHLLEEAGDRGVTTNEFLSWGAGSRFGARVHELRHEHGLYITEDNELYTLLGVIDAPQPATTTAAATDRLPRAWRCYRCRDHHSDGPICPRGHEAERVWLIDLTTPAVPAIADDDLAIAA